MATFLSRDADVLVLDSWGVKHHKIHIVKRVALQVILRVGEGIRERRSHKNMHRNKKAFSETTKVIPET